jgi:hypothetical protein
LQVEPEYDPQVVAYVESLEALKKAEYAFLLYSQALVLD